MSSTSSAASLCVNECYYNLTTALINKFINYPYIKDAIPEISSNRLLTLDIHVALIHIMKLDNAGILDIMAVMTFGWYDKRLSWNFAEYPIEYITIISNEIWTPKLSLINAASKEVNFGINVDPTWIDSQGYVFGLTAREFVSACAMDLSYFPYDTQNCYLELANMQIDDMSMVLIPYPEEVDFGFYIESQDWKVVSSSVSISTVSFFSNLANVSTIRINLALKRQSLHYSVTLIYPTILLQFLMPFVYLMPQGSLLRVTLSASLLLTMYVLQKDSAGQIPSFEDGSYPRILLGLCIGTGLAAMTLVASVISSTLCQLEVRMPLRIRKLLRLKVSNNKVDAVESQELNGAVDREYNCKNYESYALAEILRLMHEQAKERNQKKLEDHERMLSVLAWKRIDFIFNVVVCSLYVTVCLCVALTCLADHSDQ